MHSISVGHLKGTIIMLYACGCQICLNLELYVIFSIGNIENIVTNSKLRHIWHSHAYNRDTQHQFFLTPLLPQGETNHFILHFSSAKISLLRGFRKPHGRGCLSKQGIAAASSNLKAVLVLGLSPAAFSCSAVSTNDPIIITQLVLEGKKGLLSNRAP